MTALRRLAWALLPIVSLGAFAGTAARLDPKLWRGGRWPREIDDRDRRAIMESLRLSWKVYQDFFASGGAPALLDEFPATKTVRHQVFRDIGFLTERGLVQVQDLASATPLEVRLTGPDTADALVFEEWNSVLQRVGDRTPVSTPKGMGQGFRYTLARRPDGAWVVTSWAPEDVSPPERPAEFVY